MWKWILGTLAGLATAVISIALIQQVSTLLYPMPPDLDFEDRAALKAWIDELPLSALLLVIASYATGAFAGGYVSARITQDQAWPPLIVGAALLLAGFANLAMIPHPFWFAAASTLIYIPLALLGARLVKA